VQAGERDASALLADLRKTICGEPLVRLQYAELRDVETLAELRRVERRALLAVAAFVGRARLIDNIVLEAPEG
jgi:pantoate--beta-alanine ligase